MPITNPTPIGQPPPTEDARWFAKEVAPYEPMLRASLRREFPTLTEIDDVVQESYLRLMRARIRGGLRSARGFLFTTARHAAVDLFRRRKTAATDAVSCFDELGVTDFSPGVAESVCRSQEIALLAESIEALPLRCRQVLKLQKIYGLSHREIAEQLGISERTVNVQIGKGIRRCAQYLEARGMKIAPLYARKSAIAAKQGGFLNET